MEANETGHLFGVETVPPGSVSKRGVCPAEGKFCPCLGVYLCELLCTSPSFMYNLLNVPALNRWKYALSVFAVDWLIRFKNIKNSSTEGQLTHRKFCDFGVNEIPARNKEKATQVSKKSLLSVTGAEQKIYFWGIISKLQNKNNFKVHLNHIYFQNINFI